MPRSLWAVLLALVFAAPTPARAAGWQETVVAVATTSTPVLAATPTRAFLFLYNDSDTTLWCSLRGAAAVIGTGVPLPANGGYVFLDQRGAMPRAAITCIHAGTGTKNVAVTQLD